MWMAPALFRTMVLFKHLSDEKEPKTRKKTTQNNLAHPGSEPFFGQI
jgi:hypothetical protein